MNLHASHSQDRNEHEFHVHRHVQAHDEENRQDGKGEVGDDGHGAVKEGEADDDIGWHTSPRLILFPKVRYRCALKDCHEKECDAGEHG